MDVLFSNIIRCAPPEKSGNFVILDWEKKLVKKVIPITTENPSLNDPNPRGGTRGGRGIAIIDNKICVASYHTLKFYDMKFKHLFDISDNLMVDIHEIVPIDNEVLMLTSTIIDLVIFYNIKLRKVVNTIIPRELPNLQKNLGLKPVAIDMNKDNRANFLSKEFFSDPSHLHLNAVCKYNNDIFALFNRKGVIANLTKDTVVIKNDYIKFGHNLKIIKDDLVVVNGTGSHSHRICIFSLKKGKLIDTIDILSIKEVKRFYYPYKVKYFFNRVINKLKGERVVSHEPLFIRGLDVFGELLFIGLSPSSILCINYETKEFQGLFNFSTDPRMAVHGLTMLKSGPG